MSEKQAENAERRTTLKPADAQPGMVYESIGNAKRVAGTYGPQLLMAFKDLTGKVVNIYLMEEKSGIAKGLLSGMLVLPIRIVQRATIRAPTEQNPSTRGFEWALAPKVK